MVYAIILKFGLPRVQHNPQEEKTSAIVFHSLQIINLNQLYSSDQIVFQNIRCYLIIFKGFLSNIFS